MFMQRFNLSNEKMKQLKIKLFLIVVTMFSITFQGNAHQKDTSINVKAKVLIIDIQNDTSLTKEISTPARIRILLEIQDSSGGNNRIVVNYSATLMDFTLKEGETYQFSMIKDFNYLKIREYKGNYPRFILNSSEFVITHFSK